MTIEITFSHILTLASLLIGGAWALIKITVTQFSKRIDEKFAVVEKSRSEAGTHWEARYGKNEAAVNSLGDRITRLEAHAQHAPTQEAFNELVGVVAEVRGQNQTQTELIKRMESGLSRINEWLLENK